MVADLRARTPEAPRQRKGKSPQEEEEKGEKANGVGKGKKVSNGKDYEEEDEEEIESRRLRNHPNSVLYVQEWRDLLARCCFVGIFLVENAFHFWYFEKEIENLVAPALRPLPREIAVGLHSMHIILGICGASFVIISGYDTGGRTALRKGSKMMLVFMLTITWTWWINREGKPYWTMEAGPDQKNRMVHILKNISIFGALMMMQQMAKYDERRAPCGPSTLEGLVTSFRVWSFSASFSPMLVTLAVLQPRLGMSLPDNWTTSELIGSLLCVHAGANLVNSYCDFQKGVDRKERAGGDRTLVDNLLPGGPSTCLYLAGLMGSFFVLGLGKNLWRVGPHPVVLYCAFLGCLIAVLYTAGPLPLKYIGLGDLAILLCFGPLLVAYVSAVLVQEVPFELFLFTVPVSLYVVAILHANNYRDIESDARCGARTLATRLGKVASLWYYDCLLSLAHLIILAVGYRQACLGVLTTLWVLPLSLFLAWRIRQDDPHLLRTQDEETAKTQFLFGVALAMGIVTMPGKEFSTIGMLATGVWAWT